MSDHQKAYEVLTESLEAQGIDVAAVKDALKKQHIETPSGVTQTAVPDSKPFPGKVQPSPPAKRSTTRLW